MPIDANHHKEAFLSEAKTLINIMNAALMKLEKHPEEGKYFHEVFRASHTLKSLSGEMHYNMMMDLCHNIEDLLDYIRHHQSDLSKFTDVLFASFDFLNDDVKALETNNDELDATSLINELKLLLSSPEFSAAHTNHNGKIVPIPLEKIKAIEVKVERLDVMINLAEELLVSKMRFDSLREQVDNAELSAAVESLGRLVTELQFHVMQIRLVPLGYIFNRFLRMARDLAKHQKKDVKLETAGADIELDRMLVDELGESISHLIRNAIDHGIESPEVRKKKHKPPQGTIRLSATRAKESVIIEVCDDGAGLDLKALREVAIKKRLIKNNASDKEIINSIFKEISTKKTVTEISGRGLGLPIVKEKIESIGGGISVHTSNKGTSFFIEIPLSLAIIKTLFVTVGNDVYAIPIDGVDRLLVAGLEDFKGLFTNEAIIFEDKSVPLIWLSELFQKPIQRQSKQPIVIIEKGDEKIGLVVDSLLTTQEIVIKPLSRPVRNNKFFSGAALIGSGQMVLILDLPFLFESNKKLHSNVS